MSWHLFKRTLKKTIKQTALFPSIHTHLIKFGKHWDIWFIECKRHRFLAKFKERTNPKAVFFCSVEGFDVISDAQSLAWPQLKLIRAGLPDLLCSSAPWEGLIKVTRLSFLNRETWGDSLWWACTLRAFEEVKAPWAKKIWRD